MEKTCKTCHIPKPRDQFYLDKGYPMSRCKECVKQVNNKHYHANKDRILPAEKIKRSAQRPLLTIVIPQSEEDKRLSRRIWYRNNYHRIRARKMASIRKYQAKNPEKVRCWKRVAENKRRALIRRVDDGVTAEDWMRVLKQHNFSCAYCGKHEETLDIEHATPLSRGGRHSVNNIVPSCGACNSRKHTRTADEFRRV